MHFLMIVDNSIIRDKRLELPKVFTMKYGKELSDHAIIKIPNGIWHIGINKDEGVLVFENGWPEFKEFYSIHVGHLIVFRYDGNSKFQVHIFGMEATEIDYYPSHMDNAKQEVEVVSSYSDEVEIVLPSKKRRKAEVISVHSNSCTQSNTEPSMSSESTPQGNYEPFVSSESTSQSNYEPSVSGESTLQSNYEPFMSSESTLQSNNELSNPRDSTLNQKAEPVRHEFPDKTPKRKTISPKRFHTKAFRATLEAAEEFTPENPFFKIIMHATHIKRGTAKVPVAFANSYLRNITRMVITLRISDGRTWEVGYISRTIKTERTHSTLQKGWYKFVADNHLKEGDVCVFELVDREKFKINVHIFRQQTTYYKKHTLEVRYHTAELQAAHLTAQQFTSNNPFFKVVMHASYIERPVMRVPAGFVTTHFTNIRQMVITLRVSDGRTWEVGYVSRSPTNRLLTRGWGKFVADNDLKEGDICVFELDNKEKIEMIVHIFGRQKPLSKKHTPKSSYYTAEFQATLEAAEEFTSKNPFFKIIMHATHIKPGMMHVPAVFATSHLRNITRMMITLKVLDKKTWEVGYVSTTPTERKISHGWREFVADNDLKEGDVCVFELVNHSQKFEMNVHIFRLLQDTV